MKYSEIQHKHLYLREFRVNYDIKKQLYWQDRGRGARAPNALCPYTHKGSVPA